MANITEAGVRKRKRLNSQCINQIGIYKNHTLPPEKCPAILRRIHTTVECVPGSKPECDALLLASKSRPHYNRTRCHKTRRSMSSSAITRLTKLGLSA